jgi:hypothetical protein
MEIEAKALEVDHAQIFHTTEDVANNAEDVKG